MKLVIRGVKYIRYLISSNLFELLYLIKRLGLKNYLASHNMTSREVYNMMYYHYFQYLDKSSYRKELCDWYRFFKRIPCDFIDNPQTFNEKIQWIKLNDIDDKKIQCADKYAVREYIREKIGEEYLVKLYGVWDTVDDIAIGSLPNKFVLKSNTGAGRIIIIDKIKGFDWDKVKITLQEWLDIPIGFDGMEQQYIPIPRKIIAEEFIEEPDGNLHDYKLHCFHGVPLLQEYMGDRNLETHTSKDSWLDLNFNQLNIENLGNYESYTGKVSPPDNWSKMVEIAKVLAADFRYVRVDLYNIAGKILFGELTFTPCNGVELFKTPENDLMLGKLIDITNGKPQSEEELKQFVNKQLLTH